MTLRKFGSAADGTVIGPDAEASQVPVTKTASAAPWGDNDEAELAKETAEEE